MKYLKQLAGDSLIYGLSSVISGFISLLLVPVYTKIFEPADYGVLNLVNTTFFLITIFVVLGLDSAVALWFWDRTELDERKTTFATWFWFQLIICLLFTILIITFSSFISLLILSTKEYYYLFIIAALNLPFLATHRVLVNWYKYQRKPLPTVIFSLTVSLSVILLSILFVVVLKIGVKGVFIAQLISSIIGGVMVVYKLRGWIKFRFFDGLRLKEMLRFSAPLVPAALSFWALSNAGGYFIEKYHSKSEVGLYQIGVTFSGMVNMLVLAFNQAWPPFALSISKDEGHQNIYANILLLYMAIGSIAATTLWLFAPEILQIFTAKSYQSAYEVVGILGFNVFIMGIASITTIGLNLAKTNKPYATGVLIASIISIVLYFGLIPTLGKEGAAWATLTGSIILVGYVSYSAHKLYPIPYNWSKSLSMIGISFICIYLTQYSFLAEKLNLMLKMGIFGIFIVVVLLLNKNAIIRIATILKARK